jgi:putative nucleotidyltransferase with HDIG domain
MASFAAVAVENALLYAEQKRQFDSFIVTLAQSVDARDPATSNHTRMVTGVAVAIAKQMGLSRERVERIRIAAILHDYGKIGVPDRVHLKSGSHDPAEQLLMHSHVTKTILILSRIAFRRDLRDIPAIAGMHHEHLCGDGYPFGLRGEEISLEGRILAVADVFHALVQTRPYKRGFSPRDALAECLRMTAWHTGRFGAQAGPHLDVNAVKALDAVLQANGWDLGAFEIGIGWDGALGGG